MITICDYYAGKIFQKLFLLSSPSNKVWTEEPQKSSKIKKNNFCKPDSENNEQVIRMHAFISTVNSSGMNSP